MPTIEVRFEHLVAEAEVRVGNSGLPTVLNSITNTLEVMIHRNTQCRPLSFVFLALCMQRACGTEIDLV